MHPLVTLLQIAVVYLFALISPGPNFFMVTQLSLAGRRGLGIASAFGVGAGSTLWAALAMLGFAAVLQKIDWLYQGVRVAGALYLLWFGLKLLRSGVRKAPAETIAAPDVPLAPLPPPDRRTWLRTWRAGFLTCLTNPKSCVFWTSVFAAMFPAHPPTWFYGAALALVASMSFGWHASLALLFADHRTQRGYKRLRRPIDAFCGTALIGLAARLAADR
ncbi:threonine/homoserine/homoserine lactone efflux protein [Paraburkholderia eburnea]|uniref:Threonine/homoserine/homoserine lactone efflux protein n=1 Tax=Paraburkholderia eburnea TaxID=1189126 RepID=A0A2S4MP80_9BURK|nr:LysE family transporter [Paraburkholderia eburnea]POR56399.1 threonine/homoserine/homoserine lactone efflux protein [Paraburkholderia eburnea]PRZ27526.1 threonine/homoserine/homoserine lactone efflux protein [Paraburkholderia eburnea]